MREIQTHVNTFLLEVDLPLNVLVKYAFRSTSFTGLRIFCGVVIVIVEDEDEFVGDFLFDFDSFVVADELKYGMFLR